MSFELTISMPHRPSDLRQALEREFVALGFEVSIIPTFNPEACEGYVPIRVTKAPFEFVGVNIDRPAVAGFELSFGPESAHLRTAMGRTTTEFALQCLAGAILTKLGGGEYHDDQKGLVCNSEEAFTAARREIKNVHRYGESA